MPELKDLPSLTAAHYSWPIEMDDSDTYEECVRILGRAPLNLRSGHYGVDRSGGDLQRALRTGVSMILHFSPIPQPDNTDDLLSALDDVKAAGAPVDAVILDSEKMHVNTHGRAAIWEFHQPIVFGILDRFPMAKLEFYAHCSLAQASNDIGERWAGYTSGIEPGHINQTCYQPWDVCLTRHQITEAVLESHRSQRGGTILLWLPLGGGFERTASKPLGKWTWECTPYTNDIAHIWGERLNKEWYAQRPDRFGPLGSVERVCFYPGPTRNERAMEHFKAYVQGATS